MLLEVADLQVKLTVFGLDLHKLGVGLDVSALLLLITIDPDLSRVLFGSDLLVELHDLVEELLALDFILLFLGLVLDREVFVFPFGLH